MVLPMTSRRLDLVTVPSRARNHLAQGVTENSEYPPQSVIGATEEITLAGGLAVCHRRLSESLSRAISLSLSALLRNVLDAVTVCGD